jgi:excinuclease ABC subunit A
LRLEGLARRNLTNVCARLPVPGLTCVTGPSGAGKSTLVFGVLAPLAHAALRWTSAPPKAWGRAEGLEAFAHVSASESRVPRGARTPALGLLGAFAPLRELFAATLEARARGWKESRFALGAPGGRCEPCKGTGLLAAALRDAPDERVACEACGGRRYGAEVEAVRVKGLSPADVLELTVAEAAPIFRDIRRVGPALAAAVEVGLGFLPLGRPASRLSGGEVLRLKLAAALARGAGGRTLYLLDEPAAGLHPDDVATLARVLDRLVDAGHCVVAVEHDLEIVAQADHVLELGPGPGAEGGRLLHEGPPAGLLARRDCPTGVALARRGAASHS